MSRPALPRLTILAACLVAALPAAATVPLGKAGPTEVSTEGLLQYDYNFFHDDLADLDGDARNDSEQDVRRLEVVFKGVGPGPLSWVVGYDFKAERFLDTNLGWKLGETTTLVVGQAKVPIGLEELGSSRTMDFIAKAAATTTFANGRRLGVQLQTGGANWVLAGGAFTDEISDGFGEGDGFAVRGAWAPIASDGRLLHVGLAYADFEPNPAGHRLRARPQAELAAVRLVDTGVLAQTDHQGTWGLEAAWVHDRFKVQGEWFQAHVDRDAGLGSFDADSGYVSALWNLTGESWDYKKGVIGTRAPTAANLGLWQLGVRWDTIDLNDGAVAGGEMSTWTTGVNWYWRKNVRLSLNHVAVDSERNGVSDDPDIVEARLQLHW